MNVGVEILFINGHKTWIDPVNSDEFDDMASKADKSYSINNFYHSYEYKVSDVKSIVKYNLYECCGFDSRYDRHSLYCKNGE